MRPIYYYIDFKLFALLIILATFFVSCKKDGVSAKRSELNDARKKWESQKISSYQYNLSYTCGECMAGGPYQITVTNNTITAATNAQGQMYSGGNYRSAMGPFYTMRTVEEVFDYIEEGLKTDAEYTDIRYDEQYGYPRIAYFDRKKSVADDESGYNIVSFKKTN